MGVTPRFPGERLAEGRTAEVFAWQDGWVLKLYRRGFENLAANEAAVARKVSEVCASGPGEPLPVPEVGESVQIDGRPGILYTRLDGPNLWDWARRRPWRIPAAARLTAEMQAGLHVRPAPGLPSLLERLRSRIKIAPALSEQSRQNLLDQLQALPAGDRLCHGDFHPLNLIMTPGGPVVIDWMDASSGAPLADVARTWVILSALPPSASRWENIQQAAAVRVFLNVYLRRYFELFPVGRSELARWIPVVAAARLCENIPGIQSRLLELARA